VKRETNTNQGGAKLKGKKNPSSFFRKERGYEREGKRNKSERGGERGGKKRRMGKKKGLLIKK